MIIFQNEYCTVFQSAIFKTNTTIIHTPDLILVADPTWLPHEIAKIRAFVDSIREKRPLYLLFTHSDFDHILAYHAFPGALTIAGKAFIENPEKKIRLEEIRSFDDKYYIDRPYPVEYPDIKIPVKLDGQSLQVGETILTFYHAHGHNPDGIFTIVQPGNILIAGDYLSDVEFPFIYFSSTAYENTLEKAQKLLDRGDMEVLVPGHGTVTRNKQEIDKRIKISEKYIRELRLAVNQGKEYDFSNLMKNYKYPKILGEYHQKNISLIKQESGIEEQH